MKISGSRVRAFLVILWTVFNSLGMFLVAVSTYQNPGQSLPIRDWFATQHSIIGPFFVGMWGLAAIGLLRLAPKVGTYLLLTFSAWNAFTTGAALIEDVIVMLDRMPGERLNALSLPPGFAFPHQWGHPLYLIRAAVSLIFTLAAAWCAKRLFLNGPEFRRLRIGITVASVALVIAISPYLGKAFLRATIPVDFRPSAESVSESTRKFVETQMDSLLQQALADGDWLAKHCSASDARLKDYRQSVTTLDLLHKKLQDSCDAQSREAGREIIRSVAGKTIALQRARVLHTRMMSALSLTAALFLFLVLRAQQVPQWAKAIAMMAAGAVSAGWFPLG